MTRQDYIASLRQVLLGLESVDFAVPLSIRIETVYFKFALDIHHHEQAQESVSCQK